ncbi:sensor histidine kinase [Cognatiluteimonas lumbrici]|uniref:sensor histidine kinase n=1 Tax=Cognatiluteimonas lumbrici TaxID=2559601 RepID=UPI0015E3AACA|nr:ATP-binding protein [Luteimonas lumbrici]
MPDDQRQQDPAERLEQLLRQQDVFAYGISHDLRAPLRAIETFSALLARNSGDRLDETGRDHLQRIRDAAARMGGLIELLLDLSRVDRAEFADEPVDLGLLFGLAAAELQEAEPGRCAHVEIAPDLWVRGDERLLRQLATQLVRNAWNFSEGDVRIVVTGERDGGMREVVVRDHGRGFDMRYARKLFEPFQRLHAPEEGAGSGIGLAIASRVAERHGGRIRAESVPGEGSTFRVTLPAADAPDEHAS